VTKTNSVLLLISQINKLFFPTNVLNYDCVNLLGLLANRQNEEHNKAALREAKVKLFKALLMIFT
jgi:hypothetical protein